MARILTHSRFVARPRALLLGVACAAALGALAPTRAFAVRWDTYNNANALHVARWTPGGVWCASSLGLHRYDPASGRFTRFNKSLGELASDAIADVAVDAHGRTWL